MSGVGDKRFGDASLYYKVLDADTKGYLQGSQTCLVCSRNILKPNESLTFSIGIGNIVSTSVFISIEYKFEWAEDVLSYNGSNSFHSARISLSELPPDALSRLKTAIEELEKRRYKL
ncbi:MAG: hypothetical protein KF685_02060 [Acidobacteria bacterium]|nr:hypothetical protein [Acidobacteriota bacterium]